MTIDNFLKKIGYNISRFRKHTELTQKDAAALVGISYRYYQSIESGAANITLLTLHRIAKLLKVHPAELIPNRYE